ncbi:hypothetical protein DFH29DRAFT_1001530 [Suillus ampliporus]|nr:hypothetical protein DFH29DRAFT_1001530 [Suillus ampliporus]
MGLKGQQQRTLEKALGIGEAGQGSRVLYIIAFRKLFSITKLSGDEFLRAWWQVVVCHRVLWTHGVHHCDVTPSNLMVSRTTYGRVISVLNDLSLTQQDRPSGFGRAGMVPFIAMGLLTQKAKIEHLYQHDVESFIWSLTWVCLRYEDGKLLSKVGPLDKWLRTNAMGCREKKAAS